MKIKVRITGLKVHDVGYRPFLIDLAGEFDLTGFSVRNAVEEGRQVVVAKIEADEDQIKDFQDALMNRKPEGAEVSGITYEAFHGRVPSLDRTSMFNTNLQLSKGVSAILRMEKKMDQMLDKQDLMIDKQDQGLGKMDLMIDKQDQALGKMDLMIDKQDQGLGKMDLMINKQEETVDKLDEVKEDIVSEMGSIRKDIKYSIEDRFSRMEKDIRSIKSKAGLR